MGVFGGYTRWAVVFLIIFVLFFLLCPAYNYVAGPAGANVVSYTEYDATTMTGGYTYGGYGYSGYADESSSL